MSVTIIQARADELLNGGFIASGGHSEESGQRCIQEWCSYIAGEPHGAMPACVSPVLRDYSIQINDRWPDGPRQLLAPYGLRMLGTAGDGQDDARREIAQQALVTDLLPAWLRLAGMDAEADALASVPLSDLRSHLHQLRTAAWVRRNEALEPIRQAVREKLAGRHAAAAAVAAAVTVADAVAAAAAAAVAVAAAAAAADAAAAAAAAAAAVAVAGAAADAVAAADAAADAAAAAAAAAGAAAAADDPWGPSYNAAYRAAKPIFERAITEGTAPKLVMIRELAEAQRTVALDVLEKMIDPSAVAR